MPSHEIERLLPRHHAILELCLAGNGTREIAQAMDMSPQAISLITNAPIFQHELSKRREGRVKLADEAAALVPMRAKQALENASLDAANTQIELMQKTNPDNKLRAAMATEILDRTLGSGKDANGNSPVIILNQGDILIMQQALNESVAARQRMKNPPARDLGEGEAA